MSEYIVATTLRPYVQPFALRAVERVVQMRSRVESLGNLVFTTLLLQWFESGLSIPAELLLQATIGACMRAVCSRVDGSRPEPVEYIHKDIQTGLRTAQQMVISKMDRFENDQGFTQTFNQSALRYRTNLVNTLFRGFFKWQARTLLADLRRPDSPYANCKIKGLLHFLVNAMSRAIVRANPVQPELYSRPRY